MYGIRPFVIDPVADLEATKRLYGIELQKMESLGDLDAVVVAVTNDIFRDYLPEQFSKFYRSQTGDKALFDIKGLYRR